VTSIEAKGTISKWEEEFFRVASGIWAAVLRDLGSTVWDVHFGWLWALCRLYSNDKLKAVQSINWYLWKLGAVHSLEGSAVKNAS